MHQRARTQEAKDRRRQALLAAALDEFFERGFTAARMDDIAARAGVSKGAIYLYFPSKDALFTALVDVYALPNVERIEAAASAAPNATAAIGAFISLAPRLVRETAVPKIMKILIADAPAFPEIVNEYRRNVVERGLGVFSSILERAKTTGEFDIDDPQLTARLVIAPMLLSAVWHVVFERNDPNAAVDLEALFALHGKMLLRALASNPAAAS